MPLPLQRPQTVVEDDARSLMQKEFRGLVEE
jgi:hypothetical protein